MAREATPSDSAKAAEVRKFLDWALTEGQNAGFLDKVHFLPLPPSVLKLSRSQVAKIV